MHPRWLRGQGSWCLGTTRGREEGQYNNIGGQTHKHVWAQFRIEGERWWCETEHGSGTGGIIELSANKVGEGYGGVKLNLYIQEGEVVQ